MIPNILSFFRIFSSIPIILLFYFQFYYFALFLFLFAALTDFFDGLIARKLNQESDFGSLLDLIADKILVLSLLIWFVFIYDNFLIFISSFLIVMREIIVSSFRVHFLSKGVNLELIKPNFLGKFKTTSQMIAISLILISPNLDTKYFLYMSILLFLAALLSLASLQNYYSSWSNNE